MAIFDPHDPTPEYDPPAKGVTRMGDTRHAVGNISARIRREGTPSTKAEWASLMAAPKGR